MIERISLRRVAPGLAFADVRFDSVNLHDLRIEKKPCGSLVIRSPVHTDRRGRDWPSYHLQPTTREAVEDAIAALWEQSELVA